MSPGAIARSLWFVQIPTAFTESLDSSARENSYCGLFDAIKPTERPLMGSQARVKKHFSRCLMGQGCSIIHR